MQIPRVVNRPQAHPDQEVYPRDRVPIREIGEGEKAKGPLQEEAVGPAHQKRGEHAPQKTQGIPP